MEHAVVHFEIGGADGERLAEFYRTLFGWDVAASLDRAVACGGALAVPPTEIPGVGSFAMFQDPSGNLIGLITAEAD